MGIIETVKRALGANDGPVVAFLSCSVRPRDKPLVDAVRAYLTGQGFECRTVGVNVSSPEQVDDAVKQRLAECDCLIGLVTERFEAKDRDSPTHTLRLAATYVVQETSMAFQAQMPLLVFKTPDVALQGILARNIWFEVKPDPSAAGGPRFVNTTKAALESAIADLKKKALARRKAHAIASIKDTAKTGVTWAAGGVGAYVALDRAGRPDCFSEFYYKKPECKDCPYKPDCKAEKNRG